MSIEINIQYATSIGDLPEENQIQEWIKASLYENMESVELTVRIVDETEGSVLNEEWRDSQGPTNVLSFPYNNLDKSNTHLLGDIVICAPVLIREAAEQKKPLDAHWAHIVVHGTLHLLGYDHIESADAEKMEALEVSILNKFGYPDPYISLN